MRRPRNYNAGVLVEGSSTAYGYGDDSLGLGYSSRIAKHLLPYIHTLLELDEPLDYAAQSFC
ncbi:MAG TPA: hypothetical protein VLH38_05985 [Patescibacteria group bacterium]|nr:hypothetical protein [Patescibacteria group bacterium]